MKTFHYKKSSPLSLLGKRCCFLFILLFFATFSLCRPKKAEIHRLSLENEIPKQRLGAFLELKARWLYLSELGKSLEDKEKKKELEKRGAELRAVTQLLALLLRAITERKPGKIQELIHPTEGLYVDLKAHWSFVRLRKEIQSGRGYLYEVLLSQKDPLSVYRTLKRASQIEVDYYLKESAYELQLHLKKRPQASYRFNNPVFMQKGGEMVCIPPSVIQRIYLAKLFLREAPFFDYSLL